MTIYTLPHGVPNTNPYILAEGDECAVIDCGVISGRIVSEIGSKNLTLKYIILTHGHFDHVYHLKDLKETTAARICLHESELDLYLDHDKNGFNMFVSSNGVELPKPDILLNEESVLEIGGSRLRVIHTPGHTPGSICILADDCLFSGDTLFRRSVGRTDFLGGSPECLHDSITRKLFALDDRVVVYPGHGTKTTIGYERANNPHV